MAKALQIAIETWIDAAKGLVPDEEAYTRGELRIKAGDTLLSENVNRFSKTVEPTVRVSAYPLAQWLLSSWWRLLYDVFPFDTNTTSQPDTEWRMSHEMAAANSGYLWPRIGFVSDLQYIYVIAAPYEEEGQSVRYINGLDQPLAIPHKHFEHSIDMFVSQTVERMRAFGVHEDLEALQQMLSEERGDEATATYRKIEAQLGYDPDEADEDLVRSIMQWQKEWGASTTQELSVAYKQEFLNAVDYFNQAQGIELHPDIPTVHRSLEETIPWKQGVQDAAWLRQQIGNTFEPIEDDVLLELLGIATKEWQASHAPRSNYQQKASVAYRMNGDRFRFIPRKTHPDAKRFELARLVSDLIMSNDVWHVQTDFKTARQKYQKAFAAEFLSPIEGLKAFLNDDFSEERIEEAAAHYRVSPMLVHHVLADNRLLAKEPAFYYTV